MAQISLEKVTWVLPGGRVILDSVDFTVPRGGFTVILGPSGSGKTSILNAIAGTIVPTSGRVLFDGVDSTRLAPAARKVGYVFQEYSLFPTMTVLENAAFGLEMRGRSRAEAARVALAALDRVGLASLAGRYPDTLSGGEKQRVALVRSLAYEPAIVLLDEPFSSVDPLTAAELRGQVAEIRRAFSGTFLMVTHNRDEAMELADMLVVVRNGKIVEAGDRSAVLRRPQKLFTAGFLGAANVLEGAFDGRRVRVKGLGSLEMTPPPPADRTGPVWLVVRGEDLGPALPEEANSFDATVLSVDDRLASLAIKVRAGEGAEILWHATPGGLERVPLVGDKVRLRARAGDLHLLTD